MKRRALLLAALACTAPDTPTDAIVTYFRALGRDPIRTLPITTEAFDRAHGLMLVSTPPRPGSADCEQVA